MKKIVFRDAIIRELRSELARQKHAAETSRDEAISEESRSENKWDTHSQEAAYLAEGQARLAGEISASIELYATLPLPDFNPGDAIALGALVQLESLADGKRTWYFLGPRAGGLELEVEGRAIMVLTVQSPFGRQLVGKRVGDVVPSPGAGVPMQQRVVSVE